MGEHFLIAAIASVECLDAADNYNRAYSLVGDNRRNKADKLRKSDDKKRCIGAGILLGSLLQIAGNIHKGTADAISKEELLNIDLIKSLGAYDTAYNYNITVDGNGKPFFTDYPDLHFNISHSGKFVACVISDSDVGIDIEGGRDVDLRVAERFFTDEEYEWIEECDTDEEKRSRFFKIWTKKEACTKLTGVGLARGIREILFPVEGDNRLFEYEFEDYYIAVVIG